MSEQGAAANLAESWDGAITKLKDIRYDVASRVGGAPDQVSATVLEELCGWIRTYMIDFDHQLTRDELVEALVHGVNEAAKKYN